MFPTGTNGANLRSANHLAVSWLLFVGQQCLKTFLNRLLDAGELHLFFAGLLEQSQVLAANLGNVFVDGFG